MYLRREEFQQRFPGEYKVLSRGLRNPDSYRWYVFLPSEPGSGWLYEDPVEDRPIEASVGRYGSVDRWVNVTANFCDLELRRIEHVKVVRELDTKVRMNRKTDTKGARVFKYLRGGVLTPEQEQAYTEAMYAIYGTVVSFEEE